MIPAKIGAVAELDPALDDLAEAFGVATEYWDWQGKHVPASRETVVAVLAALDVEASTPEAAATALANHHRHPWTFLPIQAKNQE